MNLEEWIEATRAVKALEVKFESLLLLSATVDLGPEARSCPTCAKLMVPHAVWMELKADERPSVFVGECGSHGVCVSCAGKERARNKPTRIGGPLSDEDVRRLRAAVNFPGRDMS
jgi:hypothetical protein